MPFGFETTTDELLADRDLSGVVAVVTGGTGGIGEETVRAIAARGAHVVMAGRDSSKAGNARHRIIDRHPNADVVFGEVDLLSLDSVRSFADRLGQHYGSIDLLINNAGIMAGPLRRTAEGFEAQFGVNHLAHFVLTARLMPQLLAAKGSRVINLSSAGHGFGGVDMADPNFEHRPYTGFLAYGQSKTANILFSMELDRRFASQGVRAAAVHPGGIRTELGRSFTKEDRDELMENIGASGGFNWKTVEQGAATSVWAGVVANADEIGGRYCEDCGVSKVTTEEAASAELAAELWQVSQVLTGEA